MDVCSKNEVAPRGRDVTVPLVVDLDGTLVRSDLLVESVFALLKRNILFLVLLPWWLLHGKARLKHEVASRVEIDAGLLPYHQPFIDYLRHEHAAGRRLVLATASNERFAEAVALHLGIFHDVLASNAEVNLSGRRKLARLRELFGDRGFDYAGNAMVDLPLWRAARAGLLVNPGHGVTQAAQRQAAISQIFDDRAAHRLRQYLRAMRVHQWLKNLLVFVPLVTAHRFGEPLLIAHAGLAFLAFGLCASSVYLLNDLLDLPDDRRHPSKRDRPFAAGSISIITGAALVPTLLLMAFTIGVLLPPAFVAVLALYYTFTLAYSLRLKQVPVLDVLVLAGLYTIRIIAGAAAVMILPSFWLLAFTMFLFLSLALVKRFTELLLLQREQRDSSSGRGYRTIDLETLSQFGSASGYLAVLVLALYINSEKVRQLYAQPEWIWLLCPILLYFITRIWLLARRGELHEDPVVFLIEDRHSRWLAAFGVLLLWLAV